MITSGKLEVTSSQVSRRDFMPGFPSTSTPPARSMISGFQCPEE
jgi:hypothetical protein